MIIRLEKFGTTLVSRPSGKEAFLVAQKILMDLKEDEIIEVDFDGVLTLTPGWADEVLTPMLDMYGDRLVLKNTANLSAKATVEMLQTISGKQFKII